MQAVRSVVRTALSQRAFSTSVNRPLAKMQLIGRLADTPETQPTSSGGEITKFALGVSRGARDESGNRDVSWFRVVSFDEGARRELLASLPKGSLLYVEAEAKMDTYEKDGQQRTTLNLRARNFEVLSRPRPADGDAVQSPDSGIGAS